MARDNRPKPSQVPGLPAIPPNLDPRLVAWMNAAAQVLNGLPIAGASEQLARMSDLPDPSAAPRMGDRLARRQFSSATEFATFTGVMDPSKYIGYLLWILLYRPTTNGRGLGIQFSADNGASWLTTANYNSRHHFYRQGGTGVFDQNGKTLGVLIDDVSNSQPEAFRGVADIFAPSGGSERPAWVVRDLRNNNLSNLLGDKSGGEYSVASAANAIRLMEHSGGTHTGGQTMEVLDAVLFGLRLP